MLLLGIVVLAFTNHPHSQSVPIELEALLCVFHHDGCVIDSQKQLVFALPFWIALTFRKLEDFEKVPIGISEIEGLDPTCILVPIGQALWPGRGMLHLVLPESSIGFVHV